MKIIQVESFLPILSVNLLQSVDRFKQKYSLLRFNKTRRQLHILFMQLPPGLTNPITRVKPERGTMSNPSSTGTPDSGGAHNSAPPGAPPLPIKEPAAMRVEGQTMKQVPAWVFGAGGLLGVAGLIAGSVYLFGGYATNQQQAQDQQKAPLHVECNNDCDRGGGSSDDQPDERGQPVKAVPEPVDEPEYVLAQANAEPADDDAEAADESSELPEKAATASERLALGLCQSGADKERVWAVEWNDAAGAYLCVSFCSSSAERLASLPAAKCKSVWLAMNRLAQSNATERSGDDDLDQWRLPARLPGNDYIPVVLDEVAYDLDRPVVQIVPAGRVYVASSSKGGKPSGGNTTGGAANTGGNATGGPWASQSDLAVVAARVDRNTAGMQLLNQRVTVVEQRRRPVPFSHQAERWHASSSGM